MDLNTKKIVVTGGSGFLGRVVCKRLEDKGCLDVAVPRSQDYDLTTERAAIALYADFRPDVVIHLAAEVGGIGANRERPGRFFFANMAMGLHLIEHARRAGLEKFVQVGTVCSYPRDPKVPFREDDLWEGYPEETNAPYGIAKKSLFVMLEAYWREYGLRSCLVVPTNLYGPGDNFDPRTSHVIPALIRKCLEAVEARQSTVNCWGTGAASREFLYVEDAAEAIVRATERIDEPRPINLGTGQEVTIAALVQMIGNACGFDGEYVWDSGQPDGQPRRSLDTSRAEQELSWKAKTDLADGIAKTVAWYQSERASDH